MNSTRSLFKTNCFTYRGFFNGGEDTGRFDYVLSASLAPWNGFRVALAENCNFLSVHNEETTFGLDFALEFAVSGVILEHVDHVVQSDEGIVDSNDLMSLLIRNMFIITFFFI